MIALKFARTLAPPLSAAVLMLTSAASALAGVHYVDVSSTNATPPYTNWTTAATKIQNAVDAAVAGDEVVVTDGTYSSVRVNKPLNVRSVNGPQFTTIDGGGSVRCAYLTNWASLSGFTLTRGSGGGGLSDAGGGVAGGTLNNCTLANNGVNTASSVALGGGAAYCTLNNCRLTRNFVQNGTSFSYGGGAAYCTLNNCILTDNSAGFGGGGAYECTLNNCVVYFNTNGGNYLGGTLNYCCTTPDPGGIGNFTNAPLFDGNLRLQPNSPCINAGNNSYVTNSTDLDGNPRISGAVVDIGAYEFQLPRLTITPSGTNVIVSWPITTAGYSAAGFFLQETADLVSSGGWGSVVDTNLPVIVNGQILITRPILGPQWSYRLQQQ